MKIIRYIFYLIFLWFPNDVKASVKISFVSSPHDIINFIWVLKSCRKQNQVRICVPFKSKINFRTFYNFDLGLCNTNVIYRGMKPFGQNQGNNFCAFGGEVKYISKNEFTSFFPQFYFCLSKRKQIKKILSGDLCFDFSLSVFSFEVFLLTKDGASFKFFHLPECEKEEDKGQGRSPFRFSFDCTTKAYYFFLFNCTCEGYSTKELKKNPNAIICSVEKYFAFLYSLASCFKFCFDIMICSYLFCCIEIPIISVFELFFVFRYLFLKKKCEELSKKYVIEINQEEKAKIDDMERIKELQRDYALKVCSRIFPSLLLAKSLNFSIRF